MELDNNDYGLKQYFRENNGMEEDSPNGSGVITSNKLKGILKAKLDNIHPGYIDFHNDCTIYNENEQVFKNSSKFDINTKIPTPHPMETTEISDFFEERHKDEESSYFFGSSSMSCKKNSKWRDGGLKRERALSLGCVKGSYYQDRVPVSLSARNGDGGKCQNNYIPSSESYSLMRRLIFRIFQFASFLLILMGILTLVIPSLYFLTPPEIELLPNSSNTIESTLQLDIRHELITWLSPNLSKYTPSEINSSQISILDIKKFHFTLNNHGICQLNPGTNGIYFIILVHSSPDHFVERQAIRTTWGSVKSIRNWSIRLVFLLGQLNFQNHSSNFIQEGILNESDLYGDIVVGNFDDTYRNLTYKHLMGYKWVLIHCPFTKFVIKTDDDSFIDIFQVLDFTQRNYGFDPVDILLCNIYPEGTKPVRNSSETSQGYKWIVSKEEYPFDIYPKYCGGLGYLVTMDVIHKLVDISDSLTRFFWIDDVFVTGVIRELAEKDPFYLNLRYSYDEMEYRNWLNDRSPRHRLHKIPYMFVHVVRGPRFNEDMSQLWRKTVRAWS